MTKKILVFKIGTPEETFELVDTLFKALTQTRIHCVAAAELIAAGELEVAQIGLAGTVADIEDVFDKLSIYNDLPPEDAEKVVEALTKSQNALPKPTPVKGSTSLH